MNKENLKAVVDQLVSATKAAIDRALSPLAQRQTSAEGRIAELERRMAEQERRN